MLPVRPTVQFKKDLKKAKKQGRDLDQVKMVLELLCRMQPLTNRYRDLKLKGKWHDFRECHLGPDWLLIYTIGDFELRPARLGTHSELFE